MLLIINLPVSFCPLGSKHKTMVEARNGAGPIKSYPRPGSRLKVQNGSKGSGLQNKTFHCEICDVHVNSEIQLKQVAYMYLGFLLWVLVALQYCRCDVDLCEDVFAKSELSIYFLSSHNYFQIVHYRPSSPDCFIWEKMDLRVIKQSGTRCQYQ